MKSIIIEELVPGVDGTVGYAPSVIAANDRDFQIDDTSIEKELIVLPSLMAFYGDIHAQAQTQLARKEEAAKYVYHLISSKLRAQEKLTENGLKDKVMVASEYQIAVKELLSARDSAKHAESWWRTIQEKGNILRTISNRQMTEMKLNNY
jgi:hypothetical protein